MLVRTVAVKCSYISFDYMPCYMVIICYNVMLLLYIMLYYYYIQCYITIMYNVILLFYTMLYYYYVQRYIIISFSMSYILFLQGFNRPRLKRVNLRDLTFVLEEDQESYKSDTLFKTFLR